MDIIAIKRHFKILISGLLFHIIKTVSFKKFFINIYKHKVVNKLSLQSQYELHCFGGAF